MAADVISLTMPAERDFYRVAHLVLGGLAVRLNVTFEHLEDLQLALDGLLDRGASEGDVTVTVSVAGDELETRIGPFDGTRLARELDAGHDAQEGVGLRRILDTVVDRVELDDDGGSQWVLLTKRIAGS